MYVYMNIYNAVSFLSTFVQIKRSRGDLEIKRSRGDLEIKRSRWRSWNQTEPGRSWNQMEPEEILKSNGARGDLEIKRSRGRSWNQTELGEILATNLLIRNIQTITKDHKIWSKSEMRVLSYIMIHVGSTWETVHFIRPKLDWTYFVHVHYLIQCSEILFVLQIINRIMETDV